MTSPSNELAQAAATAGVDVVIVVTPAAQPIPLAEASSTVVTRTSGRLLGWSLANSSSASAATFTVYDGTDDTGIKMAVGYVDTSNVDVQWLGPQGIRFLTGLYVVCSAATLSGALHICLN